MVDEEYTVMLGDVRFVFHPDMFEPFTFSFREIKTGMQISGGVPSWTQEKVNNHMQLDCYSLGIESLFGQVNELCHLDWLVKVRRDSSVLPSKTKAALGVEGEIAFEGEVITFERVISSAERYRAKEWLLQAFYEILADFNNEKKNL